MCPSLSNSPFWKSSARDRRGLRQTLRSVMGQSGSKASSMREALMRCRSGMVRMRQKSGAYHWRDSAARRIWFSRAVALGRAPPVQVCGARPCPAHRERLSQWCSDSDAGNALRYVSSRCVQMQDSTYQAASWPMGAGTSIPCYSCATRSAMIAGPGPGR